MALETKNLVLIPHVPAHLLALSESADACEKISGMRVANGIRDFLLAGSADFMAKLRAASLPDPWNFGFAILHRIDNRMIGLCSFTGQPDPQGVVEIAYGIAPDYQGKGYASQAAAALVDFASRDERVRMICAHTLPETNASTRVLERCGFQQVGEIIDSEGNQVWRWERAPRSTATS